MTRFPALRAFSSRNYRLYISGQGLSLIGTWMQQLAMSWLVYRLSGSARVLGAAIFASQIPMLFLSPVAGVLADRIDRRRLILTTQTLLLVQAAALAALTHTGLVRIWHIFVLNVFFGIVTAFDMPTRQSMVSDLVERDVLPYAIPLMSSVVNVTRLIGPALGGLVIAAAGEAACFTLNALSFLAVIVSVYFIRLAPRAAAPPAPVTTGFMAGVRYAFGFPPIGAILALLAFTSLVAMPYTVLMPIFARELLHGGASTMGFLSTCSGVGALTGSIYLASRGTVRGLLRRIAACTALFGAGLMGFSGSHSFWTAAPSLFVAGFGVMVMMAACNTVLQSLAEDDRRGRVMSLYVTSLMGIAPLGGLLSGFAAARLGAAGTVRWGGAFTMVAGAVFGLQIPRLRTLIRPIYVRKGLVPARGAVDAAEIDARLKP